MRDHDLCPTRFRAGNRAYCGATRTHSPEIDRTAHVVPNIDPFGYLTGLGWIAFPTNSLRVLTHWKQAGEEKRAPYHRVRHLSNRNVQR
ncbi:MAG: hypothetical protein ACPHJ3_09000 [Rubripirellula sp.]